MMENRAWISDKLGSVIEIKYGKDHKKLSEGNFPCLGSGGIMRYVDSYLYDDESILIPRKGSLNNIMFQDSPFWTVDTMFWSKIDKSKVFPKYLFYQLTLIDYENLNVGSAVPSLTVPVINEIDIQLPPLPEQKAIASVLSSLDDKIDLLHQQNQTLEALAETLFRQWFIEEAKEDWEEIRIVDLFEVKDGTHDSPKQKEFGKKLITSKHLFNFYIDLNSAYFISEEDYNNINKRSKVERGDILFSMIGTIGNIYLEDSENINYAIKNIGLFKTSQNLSWKYFTYLWLKSNLGRDFIFENISGSTQEYISLGSLRSINFKVPNIESVILFNTKVNTLFDKLYINQNQIQTLTQLRDTLLPKLMSGEVRVKV